ncbi:SCO family protein [Bhargavaea cecembensis]|uniref:SCO family protein n=1 Tax=Bhargavaea cecembensis TaxID=394098 RepID=UPI00058C0C78|nr:SCO family protein [Bhargavaea cecembensis]
MKFLWGASALLLGFLAVFFFWPKTVELPRMGTVGEWPLTDLEGHHLRQPEKPVLVTFFFTNCPDICPTTLFDLKQLDAEMKSRGHSPDDYLVLAVTLDPEYDTNERIHEYKNNLGIDAPNWLFARGSEADTRRFTRSFNFIYSKDEHGFVTHSTSMYIADADGVVRAHHDMAVGSNRVDIGQIADHLDSLIK